MVYCRFRVPLRNLLLMVVLVVACMTIVPNPAHATEYSIPVNGRFAGLRIGLAIPAAPKWAHDVVVNASLVWNRAQLWYESTYFPDGNAFTYSESKQANVTVSFALPTECAGFAVGWTEYDLAQSSNSILSAQVFLDQAIFSASQENNVTARRYAFWLALHELGRVLGLGSVLDSHDIMDPTGTPNRVNNPPMLSTLDLFAVHVLASESHYTSPIVLNTDQYQLVNAWNFIDSTLKNETRNLVRSNFPVNSSHAIAQSALDNASEVHTISQIAIASSILSAILLCAVAVASSMLLRRAQRRSTLPVTK